MQLQQITFTRFIAAFTVVFFHYGQQTFPANVPILGQALQAGPIAVNYFYLLSGFIMAIAYFATEPDKPTLNKKKYWIARFARIYPVYLIALLLIAATKVSESGFFNELLLSLGLLQSWIPAYPLTLNAPGWSLSVEAFFYLTFPFLLLLIDRSGLKLVAIVAVILWVATQVLHIGLLNSDGYQEKNLLHDFIYYNPLMHINAFLMGIVTGAWLKKNLDNPPDVFTQWNLPVLLVSTLALTLLIGQAQPLEFSQNFQVALTNGILAPLFLIFIVSLALNKGWIAKVFSIPLLVLLGEASYSMYILQRPVSGIYDRTFGKLGMLPDQAHFYLYMLVLIIVSILSYKLFETPVRLWIRKKFS